MILICEIHVLLSFHVSYIIELVDKNLT